MYQKIIIFLMCLLMFPATVKATEQTEVKMSDEAYEVYYSGARDTFICNKTSVGSEPGTEYYMTYTVESYDRGGSQAGVIGTSEPTAAYPYDMGKGMMFYKQHTEEEKQNELLMEGYTYYIKFTALKSGFRYVAARTKGDSSEYVVFGTKAGQEGVDIKCGYFGIWVAGGWTNATLTNVRFYDKEGNDLGVQSPLRHVPVVKTGNAKKATNVDHWYTVKASKSENVAISNKQPLTTDKMYIEYTVKSTESKSTQTGIAYSNQPEANYPHGKGLLRYEGTGENYPGNLLLQEGAEYLIVLERSEQSFTALVQITKDGKTTKTGFPIIVGTHDPESQYFSLWFGEGAQSELNFVLENVKIYDANYNNLEVQGNKTSVTIRHHGAITDYSGCEAVYYCEENNSIYALFADKSFVYTENGSDTKGTYVIANNKIAFAVGDEKDAADYLYKYITTQDGKVYNRLYTYKVTFVAEGSADIEEQTLSAKTGYYVTKPQEPKMDNGTFEAWCTSDGKEFDFDKVVTESVTLYAKWKDGNGNTYLTQEVAGEPWYQSPVTVIVISASMVLAALGGSIAITKMGGRKYGKSKNGKITS